MKRNKVAIIAGCVACLLLVLVVYGWHNSDGRRSRQAERMIVNLREMGVQLVEATENLKLATAALERLEGGEELTHTEIEFLIERGMMWQATDDAGSIEIWLDIRRMFHEVEVMDYETRLSSRAKQAKRLREHMSDIDREYLDGILEILE